LRCFAVLLSESAQRDAARLQTLAFDEKLDLPLTIVGESMAGSNLSMVSGEASIVVVLYNHHKVNDRFCYRTGECDDESRQKVIIAVNQLARDTSN
jgi:hypothetical protein